MKRVLLFTLGFFALVSCNNNGQQQTNAETPTENQIDLVDWYNNVFSIAADDTTTTIPDYVFSTDWMQRYVQYIKKNFENRGGDLWFSNDTVESFDCRNWTMAYVDADTIPELLLYGGCRASGAIILTQYDGEVYASPKGCFSYIKGADGLLHSQWKYSEDIFGEIYEMRNGKFTELASYNLNSDLVDTIEVGNYGLTLDSLKCHYAGGEIGNSAVDISKIELNGKHLGACFGYNQYAHCSGFAQVKQTLDALYYSKGTSKYFPFPEVRRTIDDLVMKKPLQ